jgi:predicted SAM-dependent methyltransferase
MKGLREWCDKAAAWTGSALGYDVRPRRRSYLRSPIPPGAKLYVGCGEHVLPGYLGCDLRPLDHVVLVARAWEVSRFCGELAEVYSRHLLEHLTWQEATATLVDWKTAIAADGCVRIEVPNLDFAIAQWQQATWDDASLANRFSKARWGHAGFYGWQRECDPAREDYEPNYWDVHKSGYNAALLRYLLESAGFCEIEVWHETFTEKQMQRRGVKPDDCRDCHLVATARKAPAAARRAA